MRNYKNYEIWKLGMELCQLIYLATANFPSEEKFGLISQLRRAAVSVPSLIAEGCGRRTDKDFGSFIDKSMGSLFEIETQILLAQNLGFLKDVKEVEEITNITSLLGRKQNMLLQKLR